MLLEALGTARDFSRMHDIASILIRFGFGDMVRRMGLGRLLEEAGRLLHWSAAEELSRLEPPARIRRALEEMGPSFVKLGQILASRADLFPPDYIAEFAKLQDRVPPVPFEQVEAQVLEDLGVQLESIFAKVDPRPLAAASIAQVHRAWLNSGEAVVLKVRRPGIRPIVEADLRLLARLADIAENEIRELRQFHLKDIAAQFARSMRQELDLARECRNAERIKANFKDDPDILTPKVYWQWTGERLNVQEYVDGIPGTDLEAVDAAALDRRRLARRGAMAVLKMIFEDGFFHADPHPGNVFYLPGERLVFIDFGMVGRLSDQRRQQLVNLLFGFVNRRAERVVEILLLWSEHDAVDEIALTDEIDAFIDRLHGVPLKSLDLTALINELIALLRERQLALPPDLTLLTKAFVSLEGMGRQLDPEFDMVATAEPFLERVVIARHSPDSLAKRGRDNIFEIYELLSSLPREARTIIRKARKGQLRLRVDIDPSERFSDRLERSLVRLTMGILIAALIMGSSIVMAASGGQIPFGLTFFAMLGFFAAVLGGLWLLVSMWSGR